MLARLLELVQMADLDFSLFHTSSYTLAVGRSCVNSVKCKNKKQNSLASNRTKGVFSIQLSISLYFKIRFSPR